MSKWYLLASVFQLIIGVLAIVAYILIALTGESLGNWTVTLLLAIGYVVLGLVGILDCRNVSKKQ
ncbi:MAG TPA: hypothetical protein PLI19_01395 [Erysipelotrichaceae bacterium]|jgi:uncharacterized membrane protein HdeD (DUF308 family)|nr:hypothetical protein [Erysipelotrichaceae bacterium]HQB31962.1 hypothetical protein [Erysipelotrichaceae bacterium]